MEEHQIQNIENTQTFLSFRLSNELFALNVLKVLTILEIRPMTKVPNSPEYIRGVINLRGNVLPVIDMGIKFGKAAMEYTTNTCIIVLAVVIDDENIQLGILVDAVDSVLEIKNSEIVDSPTIGTKYKADFIHGMYHLHDGFIMLLNIDLIFSTDELLVPEDLDSNDQMNVLEK